MANKDYYIVNPTTSIVELVAQVDEALVDSIFTGKTIVETTPDRRFPAGSLYHSGTFWLSGYAGTGSTPTRRLTKLEYRGLFTLAELVKTDNFATDTSLPDEAMRGMVTLMADLAASQEISLDDPRTAAGLDFLISIGYLGAERKAQILTKTTFSPQ